MICVERESHLARSWCAWVSRDMAGVACKKKVLEHAGILLALRYRGTEDTAVFKARAAISKYPLSLAMSLAGPQKESPNTELVAKENLHNMVRLCT